MEFEKIEKLIKSMESDLNELRFTNPDSTLLKDKIKRALIDLYEEVDNIEYKVEKSPEPVINNVFVPEKENQIKKEEPVKDPEPEMVKEVQPESVRETVKVEANQVQMSMPIADGLFDATEEEEVEEIEEVEEVNIEINQVDIEKTEFEVNESNSVEFESMSIVQKHRVEQTDVLEGFKKRPIENLSSSIPIGKKFEFIEDLFIGNSEEYQRAIQNIDSMKDYQEAEEFLMINYFDKFDWTEKEKVLNTLFDFVTRRFAA
jgi:hypothetical protein